MRCWHNDAEGRAATYLALNLQHPMHGFHQTPDQWHAQAGSFDIRVLGAKPIERHEQALKLVGVNAWSGVVDIYRYLAVLRARDRNRGEAVRPVVFDRVGQQVQHDLMHAPWIDQREWFAIVIDDDLDRMSVREGLDHLHTVVHDMCQIDWS